MQNMSFEEDIVRFQSFTYQKYIQFLSPVSILLWKTTKLLKSFDLKHFTP
jgi:hypothetical protein